MLELVEMEVREILDQYGYEEDTPIIRGSALGALNGVEKWVDKVMELMDAVDTWIQEPPRDLDKPFLMPIEDVFSITGRGTVATGRIETGRVKVGDETELLGLGEDKKCVVTGVEMFLISAYGFCQFVAEEHASGAVLIIHQLRHTSCPHRDQGALSRRLP